MAGSHYVSESQVSRMINEAVEKAIIEERKRLAGILEKEFGGNDDREFIKGYEIKRLVWLIDPETY